MPLHKEITTFTIKDRSDPHIWKDLYIDEFEFPVKLKRHNITLHARIPEKNAMNGWRYVYSLTDSARNTLSGNMKLAFDIQPEKDVEFRHRESLKIIPNPTGKFSTTEAVYLYYEIYNLGLNDQSETSYTLKFTLKQKKGNRGFFKKLFSVFSRDKGFQVATQYDREGKNQTEANYINFDISEANPGFYDLSLTIIDNQTGQKTVVFSGLEITR